MKNSGILILVLTMLSISATAENVTVSIEVEGISSYEGQLMISFFNSEENYMEKAAKSLIVDLSKEKGKTVTISNLPKGEYAISIFHDENNNGELDFGAMGPKEDYGFSNNPRAMFGPASYSEAKMAIKQDLSTTIKLH